jgi:hypothetical protein
MGDDAFFPKENIMYSIGSELLPVEIQGSIRTRIGAIHQASEVYHWIETPPQPSER